MRFIIICLLMVSVCYGQETSYVNLDKTKYRHLPTKIDIPIPIPDTTIDSMDMKVFSMRDLNAYLTRLNLVVMKQFNLTEQAKYGEVLTEFQAILREADKKRKGK